MASALRAVSRKYKFLLHCRTTLIYQNCCSNKIFFRNIRGRTVLENEDFDGKEFMTDSSKLTDTTRSPNEQVEDFFGIESDVNVKVFAKKSSNTSHVTEIFADLFEIKQPVPNQEKYIKLPYGEIRLDSDNVTLYHGQFEELFLNNLPKMASLTENDEGIEDLRKKRIDRKMRENNPDKFGSSRIETNVENDRQYEKYDQKTSVFLDLPRNANYNQQYSRKSRDQNEYTDYKPSELKHDLENQHGAHSNVNRETDSETVYKNEIDVDFKDTFTSTQGKADKLIKSVDFDLKKTEDAKFSAADDQIIKSENDLQREKNSSENFIEEQFFSVNTNDLTANNEITTDLNQSQNVFQQQYFSVSQNNDAILPPGMEHIQSENVNKSAFESSPLKVIDEEDANFLDNQYFNRKTRNVDLNEGNVKPNFAKTIENNVEKKQDEFNTVDSNSKKLVKLQRNKENRTEDTFEDETKEIDILKNNRETLKKNIENRQQMNHQFSQPNIESPKTAYDYVIRKRLEDKIELNTGIKNASEEYDEFKTPDLRKVLKLDSKGFRVLKDQVENLSKLPSEDVLTILKHNILYNDNDIFAVNKPYGMSCQGGENHKYVKCFTSFLPKLAEFAHKDSKEENPRLYFVHRLDRDCTGVLLFAKTKMMASILSELFADQKIQKTYWALTKDVPDYSEGTIDIPICEGEVEGKKRMVLHPELPKELQSIVPKSRDAKRALTHYTTVQTQGNSALLEINPETGLKHQIRVHLGLGLRCPIVGDHKYTYTTKIAPQKLPDDMLYALNIRQSKARYVPMHLHSKKIIIPEILDGRNIFIQTKIPHFFSHNLQKLKYKKN